MACTLGIWLHQSLVFMHQYAFQTKHWSPGSPEILHVLSHVWLHQNTCVACLSTRIWSSWRLKQLMGKEAQSAFATCHDRIWSYRLTGAIVCGSFLANFDLSFPVAFAMMIFTPLRCDLYFIHGGYNKVRILCVRSLCDVYCCCLHVPQPSWNAFLP